tara:strand:+ start:589 stop:741 length:153 start_codon:yes stop_codon:yes gene_type:complete
MKELSGTLRRSIKVCDDHIMAARKYGFNAKKWIDAKGHYVGQLRKQAKTK